MSVALGALRNRDKLFLILPRTGGGQSEVSALISPGGISLFDPRPSSGIYPFNHKQPVASTVSA